MTEAKKNTDSKFKYLPDEPILSSVDDKFSYNHFVDTLEEIILEPSGPMNIGLFGRWGVGKSSALNLLKERLQGNNNVEYTIIDAWQLSPDYLKQDFLLQINHDFGAFDEDVFLEMLVGTKEEDRIYNPKKTKLQKITGFLKKGTLSIILFVIASVIAVVQSNQTNTQASNAVGLYVYITTMAGFLSLILPNINTLVDKLKEVSSQSGMSKSRWIIPKPELSYQFQKIFLDLKNKILNEKKTLIIALDNLDRCETDLVIEILGTIKSFMNVKGCKFIISCDRIAIENHIRNFRQSNPNYEFTDDDPKEFLSKFFQISLHIPSIVWGDLADYTDELFKNSGIPFEPSASEIISLGISNKNPRKIRQIVNNVVAYYRNALLREDSSLIPNGIITSNTNFLVKYIIIRDEYSDFHRHLENDESLLEVAEKVISGESTGITETTDIVTLLLKNGNLKSFLLNTMNFKTDSIAAFIYLSSERYASGLPDILNFLSKVIEEDTDFVRSKFEDGNNGKKYAEALIHYLRKNIKAQRFLLGSKCVIQFLMNFEAVPPDLKPTVRNSVEPLLLNDRIISYINDFTNIKALKEFSPQARVMLLNKYSNQLKAGKDVLVPVLSNFIEMAEFIPQKAVKHLNEKLAELWGDPDNESVIIDKLTTDPEIMKKFVDDLLLIAIIDSITAADETRANKQVEFFMQLKERAKGNTRKLFTNKLLELLMVANGDSNISDNAGSPLNPLQITVVGTINNLPSTYLESEITNRLYDELMNIPFKIGTKFRNRRPQPDSAYLTDIVYAITALWKNLNEQKKAAFIQYWNTVESEILPKMNAETIRSRAPELLNEG